MALARLGVGGGGESVQFRSLWLRTNQTNPYLYVEEPGSCLEEGTCWTVNAV